MIILVTSVNRDKFLEMNFRNDIFEVGSWFCFSLFSFIFMRGDDDDDDDDDDDGDDDDDHFYPLRIRFYKVIYIIDYLHL